MSWDKDDVRNAIPSDLTEVTKTHTAFSVLATRKDWGELVRAINRTNPNVLRDIVMTLYMSSAIAQEAGAYDLDESALQSAFKREFG